MTAEDADIGSEVWNNDLGERSVVRNECCDGLECESNLLVGHIEFARD